MELDELTELAFKFLDEAALISDISTSGTCASIAMKILDLAVEKYPDSAKSYHHRAVCYSRLSNWGRCIDDLDSVINLDPQCLEHYEERAYAKLEWHREKKIYVYYMRKKDALDLFFAGAFSDINRVIDLSPEQKPEWYFLKAELKREAALYDEAAVQYTKVIDLLVDRVSFLVVHNRGFCYLTLERWEDAITDFDRVIAAHKRQLTGIRGRTYAYRGMAHEKKGDIKKAKKDYRKAVQLLLVEAIDIRGRAWSEERHKHPLYDVVSGLSRLGIDRLELKGLTQKLIQAVPYVPYYSPPFVFVNSQGEKLGLSMNRDGEIEPLITFVLSE